MITYLIHTTSIWALLYIAYKVLLSKEKYFVLNRGYLLTSLVLGLLLPLVQFATFTAEQVMPEVSALYHQQVNYISQLSTTVTSSSTESTSINWTSILFAMISFGMAIMLIKNIVAGFKIKSLYKHSEKLKHPEFTEVQTQKDHLPFSFFRYIFFSAFKLKEEDRLIILNHEIHHVRAKHTWDVLFVETVKVFFWWNPLVYLYKKAITENHEYAADQAAITRGSRKEYCTLLLQSNMPGVNLNLGHPFFQTYIKKRIDMMYRKNSTWKSYLKFMLPLIAIVLMAFVIKGDDLELDFSIDDRYKYIDLYAGEYLMRPDVDYKIDRKRRKVIVLNRKDSRTEGVKYCMFGIKEPRPLSYFEDAQKQMFGDLVEVKLNSDGTKTVGSKRMKTKEIFEYLNELEEKYGKEININLSIENEVENSLVGEFLDDAFASNVEVVLNEKSNLNNNIPSISPLASKDVLSENGFGMRMHPVHKVKKFHKGMDFSAKPGTSIFATADGIVTKALSKKDGYGSYVEISHVDGYSTLYAHMASYIVSEGDEVKQGDQIGFVGSTGMSTQPHLHYEIRIDGEAIDPSRFVPDTKPNPKQTDLNQKLIKGAEKMFGLKQLIDDAEIKFVDDTIVRQDFINLYPDAEEIKFGSKFEGEIAVSCNGIVLKENEDYILDRKEGRMKIVNSKYTEYDKSIVVEFLSKESSDELLPSRESVDEKVNSDMTYEGDCKSNKAGVYFMADRMPTMESCNTGNADDDYSCTMAQLSEYATANIMYSESLVKLGFEGRLIFNVIIDENGEIENHQELLREHRKDKIVELEVEGNRLLNFIKENQRFIPAECNGKRVKGMIHLDVKFRLNEEQFKRIERRDASNTSKTSQRVHINYLSDQGNLAYLYESEMNVPYTIKVTDPKGQVVFDEAYDYIYKSKRDAFFVPNKINGTYKIEVTQDGQTVVNEIKCEVF